MAAKTIVYNYGVILPYKTLFNWNGIGRSHVGNGIGRCPDPSAGQIIAVRKTGKAEWLPNFREIAVPAEPATEAGCARDAVFDQSLAPIVPLLNQPLAD